MIRLICKIFIYSHLKRKEAARGEIIPQIQGFAGYDGAGVIQSALKNVRYFSHVIITIVTGLIALAAGSTAVFIELQDSLNMI